MISELRDCCLVRTCRRLVPAWCCLLLVGAFAQSFSSAAPARASASDLTPTQLRCEYLVNPPGIDEPHPRLSWVVESGEPGQRQTAYQILVASDNSLLQEDRGDLWDSGKVAGDQTTGIVYGGKALASQQQI